MHPRTTPWRAAGLAAALVLAASAALADHRWGRGHGHEQRVIELLETFDGNGDGRLTQEEIDAARDAQFGRFDANGDGRLSLEEYQNLWTDAMRRAMVRQFQRHDSDGDAALTKEEFRERYARMIVRFDRDGDGVITLEELRARPGDGRRGPGRGGPPPGDGDRRG
jgi:Ca2+-binding EF-hand superfamily protein